MADLDYVTVVGRFGISRVDGVDTDEDPDTVWCDEGSVIFTPIVPDAKVAGGVPPWTVGNAPITATIDKNGYASILGRPRVGLVDLGSHKLNPRVARDSASYNVKFVGVKCEGTAVKFNNFNCHPLPADLLPDGQTTNDLTIMSPVPAAGGTPTVVGPQGVSVTDAAIVSGNLQITLSDSTVIDAGAVGSGGSGSQGPKGDDGDSAYQVAVDDGFSGTKTDWLVSLVGPRGPAGSDGSDGAKGAKGDKGTAGADSTVAGPKGDQGPKGDTGPAGTTDYAALSNKPAWGDLTGTPAVIAAGTSKTAARAAIGAGTSDLQLGTGSTTALAGDTNLLKLGTTSSTALAGDYAPEIADVQGLGETLDGKADKDTMSAQKTITLGASDPVPGGTPAGTVIVREQA